MLSPFIGGFFRPEIAIQMGAGLGLIVFAVVVIVFLVFQPRGLAHLYEILRERMRHWPFKYEPG